MKKPKTAMFHGLHTKQPSAPISKSSTVVDSLPRSNHSSEFPVRADFIPRGLTNIVLGVFILFLCFGHGSVLSAAQAAPNIPTEFAAVLTEPERAFINDSGIIRVHNESDWAPFNFNANGMPKGFSIDYMKLLAQKTGLPIKFITGPSWNEFLDMIKKGELEVMLNMAKSPERQQFLEFTPSYVAMVQMLYTRKDYPTVTSIKDLYGKRFAVPKGFFLQDVLKEHPQIEIVEVVDTPAAIRAVSIGAADALFDLMPVVDYITKETQITNLKVGGDLGLGEGKPIPLHIAVRKDIKILAGILQKAMNNLTDEELQKLHEKWMTGPKADVPMAKDTKVVLTEAERSFITGKRLRLGVDDARPPFEYYDEKGLYSGISAEFIAEVAKRLGLELAPMKGMKWTEAMEKVKVGEVDVLPKVTPTKEREKFLIFTRPYITFPSVIVTRKDRLIGGMDDLRGLKIGVIKGQIIESFLKRDRPEFTLVTSPDIETALRELSVGRFDAFIDNLGAVSYTIDKIGLPNLRIAASTPYTHDLAIAVRKDWPLLASALDKALVSMTDQEKTELKNRWLALQIQTIIDWKKVGPIGAALLAIIIVVVIWNRRLGRAIRERERTEKKLLFTQYAMDKAAHAIFWVNSHDAQFSYVNDMACRQLGYERPELLRLGLPDIDPDFPPERWPDFLQTLRTNEFLLTEGKHRRKDGAVLIVELTCYLNDYEGQETIVAFVKDITERKRIEERFQNLAANVPGAIFQAVISPTGELQILYVSVGVEEHFGLSASALVSGEQRLEIHADDRNRYEQILKQAVTLGQDLEFVGQLDKKGAERQWIRLVARPSRGDSDQLIYNGLILDVTKRKMAEMEFIASERKVMAMSQAIDDALVMLDSRGRALFWNQAAEKLFGYTEDEARWLDFHEMAAPPELRAKAKAGVKVFGETGQGQVFGTRIETIAQNRQGDSFPVEVSISSFQVDGDWFAVGTVRDISHRKRAEQELTDSRQRFAQIIDFLPDPTMVIDNNGRVISWNHALEELTGVRAADILGKGDYEYALPFYGERRPILIDLVCRREEIPYYEGHTVEKQPGGVLMVETFNQFLNGGVYLSAKARPLFDAQGNPAGAIETIRDITERKKVEEEMKQYLDDLERFNKLVIGREEKMIRLKEEINELRSLAGLEKKYKIVH